MQPWARYRAPSSFTYEMLIGVSHQRTITASTKHTAVIASFSGCSCLQFLIASKNYKRSKTGGVNGLGTGLLLLCSHESGLIPRPLFVEGSGLGMRHPLTWWQLATRSDLSNRQLKATVCTPLFVIFWGERTMYSARHLLLKPYVCKFFHACSIVKTWTMNLTSQSLPPSPLPSSLLPLLPYLTFTQI